MKWTGERLETFITNDIMIEHLHRYALAMNYISNKTVLDIACGEGYGSNLMTQVAKFVVGVDINPKTIELAKEKYTQSNINFKEGSVENIPFKDNTFDVVISFETIEHTNQHEKMLNEIKRVLTPNGILIISTPDKQKYTDDTNYKNPYHIKELYADEFRSLMQKYFNFNSFFHQEFVVGSLLIPENGSNRWNIYKGNYTEIKKEVFSNGLYIIAIVSNSEIPLLTYSSSNSLWSDKGVIFNDISQSIKSSYRYQLGNLLLSPFAILYKLLKRWKK